MAVRQGVVLKFGDKIPGDFCPKLHWGNVVTVPYSECSFPPPSGYVRPDDRLGLADGIGLQRLALSMHEL